MKKMEKMVGKISKTLDKLSGKIDKLEKSVSNVAEKANQMNEPDEVQKKLESSTQVLLKRTVDLLEENSGSGGTKK